MQKLGVFNSLSLDGYFTDAQGDMSWAHRPDEEMQSFAGENASGGGTLLFGRVTYDLMRQYWPTPQAAKDLPTVAEGMNRRRKLVASRTLRQASWQNTSIIEGDLTEAVRQLKQEDGPDIVILGSGSVVAQLAEAGLIDEYQIALIPVALGAGRTMFEGVSRKIELRLTQSRVFPSGSVFLRYAAA
jgi:dihydrofolate reductase